MPLLLSVLFFSLLTFFGCDSNHSTHSEKAVSSKNRAEKAKKIKCSDASLLTCQEALDLYVSTYRFLPDEPHGKILLWSLYLSDLSKTTNKTKIGRKEMREFIFTAHQVPSLIAKCEQGEDFEESKKSCPILLEDKANFLKAAQMTRKNMPIIVEGFFLGAYVEWANKGRNDLVTNTPARLKEGEKQFYWFPWVKDDRFVVNEKEFMAFAKSKSFCDSDEVYHYVDESRNHGEVSDGEKEGFGMHPELKSRICNGESLALSEKEMLSLNFPVKFVEQEKSN